jgi:hypothetical protein
MRKFSTGGSLGAPTCRGGRGNGSAPQQHVPQLYKEKEPSYDYPYAYDTYKVRNRHVLLVP